MIVANREEAIANFKEKLLKIVEGIDNEWSQKSSYEYTTYYNFKIGKKKYCVSLCVHNSGNTTVVLTKEYDTFFKTKMLFYIYEGRNVEDCLKVIRDLKKEK